MLRIPVACDRQSHNIRPVIRIVSNHLANTEGGDREAWEYDRRLSLAGTSDTALPFFLNRHKAVNELVFCLDNDDAGREAAKSMSEKYLGK